MPKATTFQGALEAVESLPTEQPADLLDVLRRRFTDSKRQAMAEGIREARSDYSQGKVKRGTVDDLLKDLAS